MLTRTLFTIAALLLTASVAVAAADAKPADTAKAPELKTQTLCPVMGGKIDSTIYTDLQGQRVYLCCAGCIKPMKKDLDKYFKKAAAESVLFENIQEVCPVSGEKLEEKSVFADATSRIDPLAAGTCMNCVQFRTGRCGMLCSRPTAWRKSPRSAASSGSIKSTSTRMPSEHTA